MVQNMMNLKTFYKKLSNSSKNEFDGASFVLELINTDKLEIVERIENLRDGDALKLDFVRSEGKIVANVYDSENGQVGTIASYADYIWELGRSGELEIDRIEAANVIPVSKRKKGSKKAVVGAKFYLSESCIMKPYLYSDDDFDSETDVEELFEDEETEAFDERTDVTELFNEKESDEAIPMLQEEPEAEVESILQEEPEAEVESILQEEPEAEVESVLQEEPEPEVESASETVAVSAPAYDENNLIDAREDMKRKFFVTQRLDTIESIKAEIRQIMDEGIWDTRVALRNREINSKFMIDSMLKSMNILRSRRITDYLFLKFILDNVISQYEMLSEALKKIHDSCDKMADETGENSSSGENKASLLKEIYGFVTSSDQYLLNMGENLDKLWNSIPKNEQLEDMIERTFAVMTEVYELSGKSIVVKDKDEKIVETYKYVSATILKDYYEKWSSTYEYLPFIKKKKLAFYENELVAVNEEIGDIRQHYDDLKNEKNAAIKAARGEIQECEAHLSSMSIFSFNSKKTYRERIEELLKEEEQLKKDIDRLNVEFNEKVREPIVRAETIKSKISWYSAD